MHAQNKRFEAKKELRDQERAPEKSWRDRHDNNHPVRDRYDPDRRNNSNIPQRRSREERVEEDKRDKKRRLD